MAINSILSISIKNDIFFSDFSPNLFSYGSEGDVFLEVQLKSAYVYDTDVHLDGCTTTQITVDTRYILTNM